MAADREGRLRVGVVGAGSSLMPWATAFSGGRVEWREVGSVAEMLGDDSDLALLHVEPPGLSELAASWAAAASPPPAVILVGGREQPHPHVRLLETLAHAKREWEGAFDAIVYPVVVLDAAGAVRRANVELVRATGLGFAELLGRPYTEILGAVEQGADPIAASLADGRARTAEASFPSLRGLHLVTTSPLVDERGVRGLVVTLKDVAEQREQQERLRQASRLAEIGQLAAGVAHEINTPLASIALRAESLLKSAQDPQLQAIDSFRNFPRYLQTIEQEVQRCKRIISALLEFSRSRPPEVRETDLNDLARAAVELLGHQAKLRQVQLELRLDAGLPQIRADDGQLRQAILALLRNATDATAPGGRVELATARQGDAHVRLLVSDDGCGIPRENLDRVFTPFFTTKPVGQGTGLGLAICHGIVAAHGGAIGIESEVGQGTRVSVTLPLQGSGAPQRRREERG